ncbi:MAG TPA: pitrilysin family protein [Vicinamibacteria bacterium]|nr:pitrilysin family protein [Vicinamibacteria bacterium]
MFPIRTYLAFLTVLGMTKLTLGADRDVVLLKSPGSPLVDFRFVFHVGSSDDPSGKEGLAALTALMLSRGGTEESSLREVMEALYPMAAAISSQPDKEVTTFIGHAHRDHLEPFYGIFRERILRPRFDPADFERNKNELLNFLTKSLRSSDDEELGKNALEWILYEGHPYRHPVQGTVAGVESITLDDVKAFYREHYTFANLQIGIAGDVPDGLSERIREDFRKSLPGGEERSRSIPGASDAKGLIVTVVGRPAADSTAISLGFPLDITRADEDFYPLLVANIHLGDHRTFNGVLMNELRAKRGLNYGDYSYVESFIQEGGSTFPVPNIPRRQQHFSIWIRPVAPENAHFALRGAIFYLRRLVEHGMTQEQFEKTREYITSYSKLWVQSIDRRLGYQLDSRFYGIDFYIDEIERRLATMTVENVNRALRKHLDRWDFRVAVVASNAEELARAIESNSESPVTYQTPGTAEEVLAEDEKIRVLELPIERVGIVPAEKIFEK